MGAHRWLGLSVLVALACSRVPGGPLPCQGTSCTPTAVADSSVTRDGAPVAIDVLANDTDPRHATLTLVSVGAPSHGTAEISAGKVLYTPSSAGFIGADAFTYEVSNGAQRATGNVAVRGVQSLRLLGTVHDGPIAGALVTASNAGQTFTATADAAGVYSLLVDVGDPGAVLTLLATGAAGQPQVALATVLGSYGSLGAAGTQLHDLTAGANPNLDLTQVSTARYALLARANGGVLPATDVEVVQAEKAISADALLQLAAQIKVAVDPPAYALPAACADTLALALSQTCLQAFVASVVASAGSTAPFDQAAAATLADPTLAPPLAPAGMSLAYQVVGTAEPGYLSRGGWTLELDDTSGQGRLVSIDGVVPITWGDSGGTMTIQASGPLWSFSGWEDIRSSPAPLAVRDAYLAAHPNGMIAPQIEVTEARLRALARGALVLWAEETDHEVLTWSFTLGGVTYSYQSERDAAPYGIELRERAALPVVAWTPSLIAGSWAMNVHYSPGIDFNSQSQLPPGFNADLLTLEAGGTGSSRFTGRTLGWSVVGPLLTLAFSDGSTQVVRIIDQEGSIYGLWSEHRDATGALVAAAYDYGYHATAPVAGIASLAPSAAGEYWQSFVNAWLPGQWVGDELAWLSHFGFQLGSGGSGSTIATDLGDAYLGPPLPFFLENPALAWSITGDGQVRLDRFHYGTGEVKSYRLLLPVVASPDASQLLVIEEELRSHVRGGAYQLWVAPRLNFYRRQLVPVVPGSGCNALANTAAGVADAYVAQDAPAPAGGTIADGTYVLTSASTYMGTGGVTGAIGYVLREVLVVSGTTVQVVFSDARNPEVRGTFSVAATAADGRITFTPTCGGGLGAPPTALFYTATAGQLRLYDPLLARETVFTRQ